MTQGIGRGVLGLDRQHERELTVSDYMHTNQLQESLRHVNQVNKPTGVPVGGGCQNKYLCQGLSEGYYRVIR